MGARNQFCFSVQSKYCARIEGFGGSSLVNVRPKFVAMMVVFRFARMRLGCGSRGDGVFSGVVAGGLRERASAEVRYTEPAAIRKSAAQCAVSAASAAMASLAAPMRTAAGRGRGTTAPAGSGCTCRTGATRGSERHDYEEE
jgi:hypothetical protein